MTDNFQLREDAAVEWLKAKADFRSFINGDDQMEAAFRAAFMLGFACGWGKGGESAHKQSMAALDRAIEKAKT